MRQMFPEGSGGVYEVPGVGRVIGGEPFDYPELISACVPVEDGEGGDAQDADGPGEPAAPDDPQTAAEAAEDASAPQGEPDDKPRTKGARP